MAVAGREKGVEGKRKWSETRRERCGGGRERGAEK